MNELSLTEIRIKAALAFGPVCLAKSFEQGDKDINGEVSAIIARSSNWCDLAVAYFMDEIKELLREEQADDLN